VSKTVARQQQATFMDLVSPYNFGLCNRGGIDALVHLVQFLLEEDGSRVIVSIDGVGAFDHVCRARFFEELANNPQLNSLLPFVRQWYEGPSHFCWFDEHGTSHPVVQGDGGEQGDAMMPALFCLAMRGALIEIQSRLPENAFVVAYLDDVYIICNRGDAHGCYGIVQEVLRNRCHIDVNEAKLAAYGTGDQEMPAGLQELGENVWKGGGPLQERGLKVVGAPVGTPEFIEEFGQKVISEEAQLLENIPKLAYLQISWLLLYFCAVPRINHLLRIVPPVMVRRIAQVHDAGIFQVFSTLFSISSESAWDAQLAQ